MSFFEDYNQYKENKDLKNKFYNHLDLKRIEYILSKCCLESNHTFDREEQHATVKATIPYKESLEHIIDLNVYEHGLYWNGEIEYIDNIEEYLQKSSNLSNEILENNINGCKMELNNIEYDNRKRNIDLTFTFHGSMTDFCIVDYYAYYVVFEAAVYKSAPYYWGKLLLQGEELSDECKHDLAFLVIFSAFDNLINIEIEKVSKDYYKEFGIKSMEFGIKVSFLLKHYLQVQGDTSHPVRELIVKMYQDLYDFRNQVAHGKDRKITGKEYEKCFDMFLFSYTVFSSPIGSIKTNNELMKKIKEY